MYSTPTLLTILAFLALINIVIIISLYRVNRKRKQQNEKKTHFVLLMRTDYAPGQSGLFCIG